MEAGEGENVDPLKKKKKVKTPWEEKAEREAAGEKPKEEEKPKEGEGKKPWATIDPPNKDPNLNQPAEDAKSNWDDQKGKTPSDHNKAKPAEHALQIEHASSNDPNELKFIQCFTNMNDDSP